MSTRIGEKMNIAFYRDTKTGEFGAFITKETLEGVQQLFSFHGGKNEALEVISTGARCPNAIKALEALSCAPYKRSFGEEDLIADALELLLDLAVKAGQRHAAATEPETTGLATEVSNNLP